MSQPSPVLTQTTIRRLTFARYLLRLGVTQSYAPEPASSIAVLMFHDAAEWLLQVACEAKNVGASNLSFMEYFSHLERVLPSRLAHHEAMRRLNDVRQGLKHFGTLPSRVEIESLRSTTESFFADNVPLVFGVPLATLSLVEFVASDAARRALRAAEEKAQQNDPKATIDRIAVAFQHVLLHHKVSLRVRDHRLPIGWDRGMSGADSRFRHFLQDLAESVVRLEVDVGLLRHGIDPRRLARFQELTPHVAITQDGTEHIRTTRLSEPTREEADFCMTFVLEIALLLQQDELSLNPIPADSSGP